MNYENLPQQIELALSAH